MNGATDASRDFPSGYRLRPPKVDEVSDIGRLTAACDSALGAPPSLNAELIRQFWARPRFVLETDAWVVEVGRSVVGYAEVWDMDPTLLSAFAVVHPDHTARGIGSALAALIEGRAAEKASRDARLFSSAITQDQAAAQLLAGRGYSWARRFWHMEVELEGELRATTPPSGIELRPLDPEIEAAHRILEKAFEDHWGYSPTPYEESSTAVFTRMTSIRLCGSSHSLPTSRSACSAEAHTPIEVGSSSSACSDRIEVEE